MQLQAWASEGFFPGGGVGDFPKKFSREVQKWWNLCFTPRNWKNNLLFPIISKYSGGKAPPSDAHGCKLVNTTSILMSVINPIHNFATASILLLTTINISTVFPPCYHQKYMFLHAAPYSGQRVIQSTDLMLHEVEIAAKSTKALFSSQQQTAQINPLRGVKMGSLHKPFWHTCT